jgi:hypothetical protein
MNRPRLRASIRELSFAGSIDATFGAKPCSLGNQRIQPNMKTNTLPVIAFLAVIAAVILLPVGAVAAGIAVTVTGIFPVLVADYGRNIEPLRTESRVIPFNAPGCRPAGWREAA